ncbi:family 6 glucosyltransferase [Helicobacter sp. 11S02629-2]|uniref:family 6 glucosyltransferase n=1 Tax=Helicobacter sp. 11S02629-2 TaxID=1476195 RepID=UPI000BA66FE0|nr:family 6 glucosyltransferase [Helicobacter sp. 11S02629-2]PAF45726.1 hypothetical protein BKH40_02300 [Helicobacter sp. 11S02629-2]
MQDIELESKKDTFESPPPPINNLSQKDIDKMKIAILYIATGRYDVFFEDFYKSMEKFFIKDASKHYFVWTDSKKIETNGNITKIYQEKLGWPYDTLLRYDMFWKIKDELSNFDYIFFFNANMVVKQEIFKDEFLPDTKSGLVGCLHPGFIKIGLDLKIYPSRNAKKFTYDKNPKSLAFIEEGRGSAYYAGGLNGGSKDAYLKLIKTLKDNIQTDMDNGVTALWHDESHINKYFLDKEIKALSSMFLKPEGWYFNIDKAFVMDEECMQDGLKRKEFTENLCSKATLIPRDLLIKLLEKQYGFKNYESRYHFMKDAINDYFDLEKHTKILLLDKANPKYGGHAYLRGEKRFKSISIEYRFKSIKTLKKIASSIKAKLKRFKSLR